MSSLRDAESPPLRCRWGGEGIAAWSLCPQVDFYALRAEAFIQLCDFSSAVQNLRRAYSAQPENMKHLERLTFVLYLQVPTCTLALGLQLQLRGLSFLLGPTIFLETPPCVCWPFHLLEASCQGWVEFCSIMTSSSQFCPVAQPPPPER